MAGFWKARSSITDKEQGIQLIHRTTYYTPFREKNQYLILTILKIPPIATIATPVNLDKKQKICYNI